MSVSHERASLAGLPTEILLHFLGYLEPLDLAQAAQTCRKLAATSYDDIVWSPIVNEAAGKPVAEPTPMDSFRALYISLFPYWFLTKQRVWFGDTEPSGKLLLAHYDTTTASIVAHQVAAVTARSSNSISFWEKDTDVVIISFDPVVTLDINQPVLKIDAGTRAEDSANTPSTDRDAQPKSRYGKEVMMDTFIEIGLHSSLMLCRTLSTEGMSSNAALWPPLRIPASSRTRNASQDGFRSAGHRPEKHSEISQNNFRLKKWVEYRGRDSRSSTTSIASGSGLGTALGMGLPNLLNSLQAGLFKAGSRMPENITTFSSLPAECYTPTREKPWQGIFCGDYSAHGCEFLLITQPDASHARPLPAGMDYLREWFRGGRRGSLSNVESYTSAFEEQTDETTTERTTIEAGADAGQVSTFTAISNAFPYEISQDYNEVSSGRLEAIKLTGDPNVPRSQYSFIAPEIGHGGFLRVADEPTFQGARVVRSAGHTAQRGFMQDQYSPSQLIMISHDRLAQFWQEFGHISYYQRVDIESLLQKTLTRAS